MAKHLARDLEALQRQLLGMASRVEESVYHATKALETRDVRLAREVIAGDVAVDALENEILEDCLKILALNQPVAVDLRKTAAALSIATNLERIGDLAVEIAERVVALVGTPGLEAPGAIRGLADVVASMVRQAIDAFVSLDIRQAERVIRLDDEADRLHAEVIDELVGKMKRDPEVVEAGVSMFSAARHLERIGDHATNIAEDVVYLIEGEIVRHRPKSSPRGG
ncbi:phosphate signaling complex protein PhoU [Fimbriiglobus ruber]|uniref:Phosphate-specific transport system accessory protein PhoU n=1 Tax=Fimbriiglobus ruber TaxID=1908690 RepID=A0A225D8T2_9BACT|nr:phosphate signaling complex protein PhoU [Fimbriiglobus ruber]OWK38020.1 Phosphate transport system regulatory protein PhoU [Fimbriiglobus ruber]